jgi:uncharacterized repeat protein (TIGR01451 family)
MTLGAVCSVLLSTPALAADSPSAAFGNRPAEVSVAEAYHLPGIVMPGLQMQRDGSALMGSFTVENVEPDYIGDISYQLQVWAPSMQVLESSTQSEDVFGLQGKEQRKISFRLPVGGLPAGDHVFRVQIVTAQGRELGWKDQGFSLQTGAAEYVSLTPAAVSVPDAQNLDPLSGPNVDPGKQVTLKAIAKNTGNTAVTVTPALRTYQFSMARGNAAETAYPAITLQPGETRQIEVPVTASGKPEVYAGMLSLLDGKTVVSSLGEYRWVVRGADADIFPVRVSKMGSQQGEVIQAKIDAVGAPDAQTVTQGYLHIRVSDDRGTLGETTTDVQTFNDRISEGQISFALPRTLVGTAKMDVTVSDVHGAVLAHQVTALPVQGAPALSWSFPGKWNSDVQLALLCAAALLCALAFVKFRRQQLRPLLPGALIASVFLLLGSMHMSSTFAAGNGNGIEVATPGSSMMYHNLPGGQVVALFINAPIHDAPAGTYQKNAVPLQYRITFAVCMNRISYARVIGRIDANGGKQTTLEGTNANWQTVHDVVYQDGPNCPDGSPEIPDAPGMHVCYYSKDFSGTLNLSALPASMCSTTLQMVAKLGQSGLNSPSEPGLPDNAVDRNDVWFRGGLVHAVNLWLNFPCGPTTTTLSVQKSGPTSVTQGNTVTYTVAVANTGQIAASNVAVTDNVPAGLTYASFSGDASSCSPSGSTVSCTIPSIPAGQTKNIQLTFTAAGQASCTAGQILNVTNSVNVNAAQIASAVTANAQPLAISCSAAVTQCRDGIDNDGDGAVDSADFSCSSPDDNDETNPKAQCQDGIDNDGDGLADFPQDPGCQSRQDNDETNAVQSSSSSMMSSSSAPVPQCRDGIDNDNDGVADFNDPGCYTGGIYNPNDNDETNTVASSSTSSAISSSSSVSSARAQCADGIDNDGDGVSDFNDPGCYTGGTYNPNDNDERNQCSDGIDNDNDGVADFNDPGCYTNGTYNPQDNDETNAVQSSSSSMSSTSSSSSSVAQPQCSDGVDNDHDGRTDIYDPGCYNGGYYTPWDNDETDPILSSSSSSMLSSSSSSVSHAQCSDGMDNDNDGRIDIYDPGCYNNGYYDPNDNSEQDAISSSSSSLSFSSSSAMSSSSSSMQHPQCSDGIDNDNDGRIDIYDPGCYVNGYYNPWDNDETDTVASSSSSSSIMSSSSSSSSVSHPQCSDGADNDHDGRIDAQDPGCYNGGYYTPWDNDETDPVMSSSSSSSLMSSSSSSVSHAQCSDGMDNDNDGRIDIYDPGCYMSGYYNPWDDSEQDNNVSSSSSSLSSSSSSVYRAACSDGMDNDNDGRVDFNDPGCYQNGIYDPNDNSEQDNISSSSSSSSSQQNQQVNLQIIVNGPSSVNIGGTVTYNVTVLNTGNTSATNTILNVSVSGGLAFLGGSNCQTVNGGVTCNLGTLGAGQTQNLSLSFRVNDNQQCVSGSIVAVFLVHSDQADASAGNNTYTSTVALQCPNAVLTLQKTDDRTTANPGDTLTYTLTVRNSSPTQATNVQVTDMMPDQLQFLSASDGGYQSGQTVTWNNLTIPAYGQKTITVQARVSSSCQAGVLLNSARITSGGIVDAGASDATLILAAQAPYYPNNNTNWPGPSNYNYNTPVNLTSYQPSNTIVLPAYQQQQPAFQPIPYGTFGGQEPAQVINVTQVAQAPDLQSQQELQTMKMLPQTGGSDRTGPLPAVAGFLFPSAAQNAALPGTVWGSLALTCLGFGARLGRRFFI